MLTNSTSITVKPPLMNAENVHFMLERVGMLFPELPKEGAEQCLCDLLSIESIDDLSDENVVFQNIEPAVSRSELRELSERILGYCGNDQAKAIFAVRNILNTVPQRLDDLIDYTTEERLKEFLADAQVGALSLEPLKCLDDVEAEFAVKPDVYVNLFGNSQMEKSRNIPDVDLPALTTRQRYLYKAADYYLNHRAGFRTNTMWLAYFLSSDVFGCAAGWLHRDGELCQERHFGFKDDDAVIKLVLMSEQFIYECFSNNEQGEDVLNMYIDAVISALKYASTRNHFDVEFGYYEMKAFQLHQIADSIAPYMQEHHRLKMAGVKALSWDPNGITREFFDLLKSVVAKDYGTEGPGDDIMPFFDAWNFLAFDMQTQGKKPLAMRFIQSSAKPAILVEFASLLIEYLRDESIEDVWRNMFEGYFTNYLYLLVNSHSDSKILFDEILQVSIDASLLVDNGDVIRTMAELGHKPSQDYLSHE